MKKTFICFVILIFVGTVAAASRDRYYFGPDVPLDTILVAASNSSKDSKTTANYVCDGTADQVQINNALTSLSDTGGIVVLISGTYEITDTVELVSGVTLEGQGSSTVLSCDSIGSDGLSDHIIDAQSKSNIQILRLKVDSSGRDGINSATPANINIEGCDKVLIEDVFIYGTGIAGDTYTIDFDGGELAPVVGEDIFVDGEEGTESATVVEVDVSSGSWAGSDAAGTIIVKDSTAGFISNLANDDTLENSDGDKNCDSTDDLDYGGIGSGDGIRINGSDDTIINNCRVEGAWHNIFAGRGSNNCVISNIISHNSGVEHLCLEWDSGGGHSGGTRNKRVVVNNVIGTNAGQYGMYLTDWDDVTVSNISFSSTHHSELFFNYCDGAVISDFISVDAACAGGTDGAFGIGDSTENSVFKGCITRGSLGEGFMFSGSDDVTLIGCVVEGNTGTGTTSSFRIKDDTPTNIKIIGCTADQATDSDYAFDINGNDIMISNCQITGNYGQNTIQLRGGSRISIKDCFLEGTHPNGKYMLYCSAVINDLVFSGNYLKGNDGIVIEAVDFLVCNNMFVSSATVPSPSDYLVQVRENCVNGLISHNVFTASFGTTATFVDESATDVTVADNVE